MPQISDGWEDRVPVLGKPASSVMGMQQHPSTGRLLKAFLTAIMSFFLPTDATGCKAPAYRALEWVVIGISQSYSSLFPFIDWSLGGT